MQRSPITERGFQRAVVATARLFGWRVHHTRPALNQRGRWLTPVQGDVGFPDLVMARQGRVIFAELKQEGKRPSPHQRAWLDTLATCAGVEVYLWTPADWKQILEVLKRPPQTPTHHKEVEP